LGNFKFGHFGFRYRPVRSSARYIEWVVSPVEGFDLLEPSAAQLCTIGPLLSGLDLDAVQTTRLAQLRERIAPRDYPNHCLSGASFWHMTADWRGT